MYTSGGHQNKATTAKKYWLWYHKLQEKKKKKVLRPFWKYEVVVLIYLAAIAQKENTKKQIKNP